MQHPQAANCKYDITIGNISFKVNYYSWFNDSFVIQSNYPFSWGHEIDFNNRNADDIKQLNNSVVAIWHIKERK